MGDFGNMVGMSLPESGIGADVWALVNLKANEVIGLVHPTLDTEEKRQDITDYLQRLLKSTLNCEVYIYGSVPLKTYLPDGDIDLTAFCGPTIADTLPHDALSVLQSESNNPFSEYEVKDVKFIDAEVKLVKCNVGSTMVDLSFNQLGGLGALCFLEMVDRIMGKNHLLKSSIILIKAWCFYESRILGANFGLLSTYALEILVLYIFQFFHARLDEPLTVLYEFLNYFNNFQWDKYCISLKGPVRTCCLPNRVVDMPGSMQNECLLTEEFFGTCTIMFSTPTTTADTNLQKFQLKSLNVIDPLNRSNNLGRSISKYNLNRIQSAFRYGAEKLSKLLTSPNKKIGVEVKFFFGNVFNINDCKERNLIWSTRSRSYLDRASQVSSSGLHSESKAGGRKCEITSYSTAINPRPDSSDNYEIGSNSSSDFESPDWSILGNLSLDCRDKELADIGSLENSNPLADLTGDYDKHIRSLSYAQSFRQQTVSAPNISASPPFSPNFITESPSFSPQIISEGKSFAPQHASEGHSFVPHFAAEGSYAPEFAFEGPYEGPSFAPYFESECSFSPYLAYEVPLGGPQEGAYEGPYGGRYEGQSFAPHCSTNEEHFSSQQFINKVTSYTPQFVSDRTWSKTHLSLSMHHSSSHLIDTSVSNPQGTGTYIPNTSRDKPSRERGGYHGPGQYRQYEHSRSGPIMNLKKTSDEGPTRPKMTEALQDTSAKKFDESKVVHDLEKIEFGSLGKDTDGSIPNKVIAGPSCGDKVERVGKQAYRLDDDDFPPLGV